MLSEITIPYQTRKSRKGRIIPFEGIDVETDKTGYARIGANSKRYTKIKNIKDVLRFLCSKDFENKLNFHYNLAFDFEVMFKYDPEIFKLLIEDQEIEYKDYNIKYIPRKIYSISTGHHTYKFYDIAQFFKMSLDDASIKYLKYDFDKLEIFGTSYLQFKEDRKILFDKYPNHIIGKYCINDSLLTKELAKYFYQQLKKIDLFPLSPVSPGSVAEDYLKKNTHIPYFTSIPKEIQNMYWMAYRGGWFDTYKKGYFNNAWQYDISSAYPYSLSQIPDPERGRWLRGTDSNIGVMKALVRSKKGYPVFPFQGMGVLVYYDLIEYTEIYMTLIEYHTLKNDYVIKVIDSWYFEPSRRTRYPFDKPVQELYKAKQQDKKDIGQYMVKKEIINSFYGKTAQRVKIKDIIRAGNMFNPYIACECTARTRMQVYRESKKIDIISFCADGFISSQKAKMELGDQLGEWEIKQEDKPLIQVGNGIYQFEGGKCKHRGWKEERDLSKVLNTEKNPIEIIVKRPWHWRECVIQHRIDEVGIFEEIPKKLDIIKDKKRFWLNSPETPKDLLTKNYKSVPIPLI